MTKSSNLTIAVVLITYNQQDYIIEALEAIRSQSREPDEVVIADDCSTDKTQMLITNYVEKHNLSKKWTLLFSPFNRGINENLQNGYDHTTADIIIGMAGDDISLPERCKVTEDLFEKFPECAMISTSGYIINSTGVLLGEHRKNDKIFSGIRESIIHGNPRIHPVGHAYRREIIYSFGVLPNDIPNEDDQITFRGLLMGGIACSSIKTYRYRIHNESASSWLHKPQSSKDYFERFKRDMSIRARHMHYWNASLQQTTLTGREYLGYLIELKQAFFIELQSIDTTPLYDRILLALKFRSVTSLKDLFYLLFGRLGVIFWRSMRRALRGI